MTVTEPRTEPLATQDADGRREKKGVGRRQVSRTNRSWLSRFLNRFWLVLVVAAVVSLSGFCVYRLHGIFGVHGNTFGGGAVADQITPFNPKTVRLEVWGPPGSTATISYLDKDSHPQQVLNADIGGPEHWAVDLTTTQPAVPANLVAQGSGDWIACKITLDENDGRGPQLKATGHSDPNENVNAFTYCLSKSA